MMVLVCVGVGSVRRVMGKEGVEVVEGQGVMRVGVCGGIECKEVVVGGGVVV